MRRMSFALTTPQVRAHTKTVTRRFGWLWLVEAVVAGPVRVAAVEKAMGFRKGERAPAPFEYIDIVGARREPLDAIDADDVVREGFPGRSPAWFVAMLCDATGHGPGDLVTRIEFRYVKMLHRCVP